MLQEMKMQEFDAVYQLMELSFPREEYRPREGQRALLADPAYTVYVVHGDNGEIAALATVWELGRFALLEHLAVAPSLRNGGMGGRILHALAERCQGRLCLEVELPETDLARRRIGFYERNGFVFHDYPYEQPPLSADRAAVPLRIMTQGGKIDRATFEDIRSTIYRRVYHCL